MRFSESDEFEEDDEEMAEAYEHMIFNKEQEIKLTEKSLRIDILDKAMFICKSNWKWWFMSQSTKIKNIIIIYRSLKNTIDN